MDWLFGSRQDMIRPRGRPRGPEGVGLVLVEVVLGGGPSYWFDLGVRNLGEPGERAVEGHSPLALNLFGSRTPRVHCSRRGASGRGPCAGRA